MDKPTRARENDRTELIATTCIHTLGLYVVTVRHSRSPIRWHGIKSTGYTLAEFRAVLRDEHGMSEREIGLRLSWLRNPGPTHYPP